MKHTIRWLLLPVVACAICSLVMYRMGHHTGYESGYKSGLNCGLRQGTLGQTIGFLAALQQARAGNVQRATRIMEKACFDSAKTFYFRPTPTPGEASEWGRAQGLDRYPDASVVKVIAKELLDYRAVYRTNRADWDDMERELVVELANVK